MITARRLRELLSYNPDTGVFVWRQPISRKYKPGQRAGAPRKDGRWRIGVDGGRYMSSVLAVLWMTGKVPKGEVDHKNRDPADDRWVNLRLCRHKDNGRNTGLRKDNTSGYIGVFAHSNGRFLAYTRNAAGRRIYLGFHDTAEMAADVRDKAAKRYYGDFAVLNSDFSRGGDAHAQHESFGD